MPRSDKNNPHDNSFENLIALCPNCHWITEQNHSNSCITLKELKKQKLYWMIASGRITRMEIDLLMALNQNVKTGLENRFKNGIEFSDLGRIDIKNNTHFDSIMDNIAKNLNKAKMFLTLKIPLNLTFLVSNLINLKMINDFKKRKPHQISLLYAPHDKKSINREIYQPTWFSEDIETQYIIVILPSCSTTKNGIERQILYDSDNVYYWINNKGKKFCEKFKDVYETI